MGPRAEPRDTLTLETQRRGAIKGDCEGNQQDGRKAGECSVPEAEGGKLFQKECVN